MKVLITGATGTIGGAVADALLARGDEVVGLSRDPERATAAEPRIDWHAWNATEERPAAEAFDGVDGVVNLVGEPINQRWTDDAKRAIRESRITATKNLVAGMLAAEPSPGVLVSGSAVGYYGDRGTEFVDESTAAGSTFDAQVCVDWEAAAQEAEAGGVRVALIRTGLLLTKDAGLLAELLLPFKLGVGGPVAGGRNYMPWISLEDEVGIILWALDTDTATGPFNATAPNPVTNREFSKALGRALHRPAVLPVPKLAVKARFGSEFGEIAATAGQRALPKRATEGGYEFRFTDIDAAMGNAVG
ncbi:MAG: TIGR01777 family oxidoreductase [Solirubrobacterales bacterium]